MGRADGQGGIAFEVTGAGVSRLDSEVGGHRVQRVPKGDKRGRVHSSTVTVAVLDPARAAKSVGGREPSDFEVEWYSGSGSGGQHRNIIDPERDTIPP